MINKFRMLVLNAIIIWGNTKPQDNATVPVLANCRWKKLLLLKTNRDNKVNVF